MKKYKKGSELKPVPSDRPGLGKLPSKVRNAMGYMKSGGSMIKKQDGGPIPSKIDVTKKDIRRMERAINRQNPDMYNKTSKPTGMIYDSNEKPTFPKIEELRKTTPKDSTVKTTPIYNKKRGGSIGNAMSAVKKGFDQAGAMITSKKAYGGSMVNKPANKMLIKAMQAGGPMDMVDVVAMKKGGCMKCGGSMKKMGGAVINTKMKK
jgi:hypothetical protein